MARQHIAQHPISGNGSPATPGIEVNQSPLITFEPQLAVQAIVFHLLDEGISTHVSEASIKATLTRLKQGGISPSVEQWAWADMSHRERLQWLLDKTQTASRLVSDELSILEPVHD